MWNVNQRRSFDFLFTRRKWKRKGGNFSFQVITHNLAGNLAHSLLPSQTNPWWFEPPGKAAVFRFCCIFMSYLLRSLNLFQGMARPAFIANVSAAPISIVDKIPALSNKALLSSSLRVSTSLWIRAVGSPALRTLRIICISEYLLFKVLELAAVVCWRDLVTCINVIG